MREKEMIKEETREIEENEKKMYEREIYKRE
jgi:hypothetical protein